MYLRSSVKTDYAGTLVDWLSVLEPGPQVLRWREGARRSSPCPELEGSDIICCVVGVRYFKSIIFDIGSRQFNDLEDRHRHLVAFETGLIDNTRIGDIEEIRREFVAKNEPLHFREHLAKPMPQTLETHELTQRSEVLTLKPASSLVPTSLNMSLNVAAYCVVLLALSLSMLGFHRSTISSAVGKLLTANETVGKLPPERPDM
jgi:hypothetical protein